MPCRRIILYWVQCSTLWQCLEAIAPWKGGEEGRAREKFFHLLFSPRLFRGLFRGADDNGEESTPLTDRSVVLEFLFWGIWPGGGVVGPSEKFGGASSSQFLLSPLFLFLSVSVLSLLPSLPQCRKLRLWGRDLTGRKSGGQISPLRLRLGEGGGGREGLAWPISHK